jgi:hypothetical protein
LPSPLASRVDDLSTNGAQARANVGNPAIDEQNIRTFQPFSGAGKNRRSGKKRRFGWQRFIAALIGRWAITAVTFFVVLAASRSQQRTGRQGGN